MDEQHAGAGALLIDDIFKEDGALLRRRQRAEGLVDRHHVIVDGLGQAHDGELVVVLGEIGGEIGRRGVGVIAADGVEDGDAIAHQLFGRHLQRVLAFLHQAALDAILHVGELHPAVAQRRAAMAAAAPGPWRGPWASP